MKSVKVTVYCDRCVAKVEQSGPNEPTPAGWAFMCDDNHSVYAFLCPTCRIRATEP